MSALSDFDVQTLSDRIRAWGHPASHAPRVLRAYYDASGRPDLSRLSLGEKLRARLVDEIGLRQSGVLTTHESADGTVKILVGFAGGGAVETVLMPSFRRTDRAAGCVSSQIGCAMGCDFCASTRGGLERNLTAGEIVEQFLHLRRSGRALGRRLTSLVFMGMGEPMHNLDNVIAAIRRIADPRSGRAGVAAGDGLHRRHRPAASTAWRDADLNVHLAVSLHAPDDATRSRLVPANRR